MSERSDCWMSEEKKQLSVLWSDGFERSNAGRLRTLWIEPLRTEFVKK